MTIFTTKKSRFNPIYNQNGSADLSDLKIFQSRSLLWTYELRVIELLLRSWKEQKLQIFNVRINFDSNFKNSA